MYHLRKSAGETAIVNSYDEAVAKVQQIQIYKRQKRIYYFTVHTFQNFIVYV